MRCVRLDQRHVQYRADRSTEGQWRQGIILLVLCGSVLGVLTTLYSVMAWIAVTKETRSAAYESKEAPPVTILKPLCGAEPETYAYLRSFCDQDYPEYQVVFGVANAGDPALAIVERLQREFPDRDLKISIDRRQHGSNRKVSNLINMMELARHEVLVLADSDVCVANNYLEKIAKPLVDKGVGIVTCTYRGNPRSGFWSLLGSLFINDWFIPSVRVSAMCGSRSFAFGATIAIRREVLSAIGGLASIANHLADDYRLGELTRRAGLRSVLSEVVVETLVAETTLSELIRHELRWLRTIRAVRPLGYGFLFITFGLPVAALGSMLAVGSIATIGMLATTLLFRVLLHLNTRPPGSSPLQIFILPLRDILSLGLWSWSFATRRVQWRDCWFHIARDGSVQVIESV
jgi:ceramide glucosyltransferase